jgi:D-sedoheptulose 7-phosphate isomerase
MGYLEYYEEQIQRVTEILFQAYLNDKSIYIFGNGGSMADAPHFASDLISRGRDHPIVQVRAIPLSDPTILTALSNDYGLQDVFKNNLFVYARKGDVAIGITTSGESENIVNALRYCRENGITTIGLLGRGGGSAREYCDIAIIVPGDNTAEIQNWHRQIYHEIIMRFHSKVEQYHSQASH